jgi:putative protease
MGRDAADHRGVLAGIVEFVDEKSASLGIRLTGPTLPEKGDGLLFREPGDEERDTGMILRTRPRIEAGILRLRAEQEIRKGARVFITRRGRLPGVGACPPSSRISLDLLFRAGRGAGPVLEGSVFRNGIPVTVIRLEGDFTAEPRRAQELTGEEIREILSKRGESPYHIGMVSVEWPEGSYARKGAIGRLRRELLAEVERFLVAAGRPDPGLANRSLDRLNRAIDGEAAPHPAPARRSPLPTLAVLTDSLDTLAAMVGEGSGIVALEPGLPQETQPVKARSSGACAGVREMVREAMETAAGTRWSFLWKWPRITGDPWLGEASGIIGAAEMAGLPGVMVEGPGAALAARAASPGLPIHGGAGLNAWNALAVRALSRLFSSIILSPELSREDLGDLASRIRGRGNPPLLGFPVQGNLEVMVSEDRLAALLPEARAAGRSRGRGRRFTGLRDGTGRIFPVEADCCGRTRILNPVETCLVDQLPALVSTGIGLFSVDARGRGPRYGLEMAAIYREAISVVEAGGAGMDRELDRLREECRMRARGGITHGAFLRGLREEDGQAQGFMPASPDHLP